jgi:PAS domain-containing protein
VAQSEILAVLPYATGVVMSLAGVFCLAWRSRIRSNVTPDQTMDGHQDSPIFVLRYGKIIETNFAGRRLLDRTCDIADDETRLRRLLSDRFEKTDLLLADPDQKSDHVASSRSGNLQIIREVAGDLVKLRMSSRQVDSPGPHDMHSMEAETDELNMLRTLTQAAPFHVWRQNSDGEVTWANKSYLSAVAEAFGSRLSATWPIPALFPDLGSLKNRPDGELRRVRAQCPNEDTASWYDCQVTQIGADTLFTAFRADEAMKSEARRQEFTQTLTKTFSDLTIGLAIFDRSRRLVLFNPALTNLTSLPIDFLTSRPSLPGFLDRLRENRVMPELRDYPSWRKAIAALESEAMSGTYAETWSLPGGQTYRVNGRPHPDGALAFLFEDISAEMSLTRRFRSQLEQSQSIFDALDDAVALFSATGEMTFSNAAYKELWGDLSEDSLLGSTVVEATRKWHQLSVPTPVWGDFRDFAFHNRERSDWSADVTMRDGRRLACRFIPQKGGSSLAIFSIQTTGQLQSKDLREAV